MIDCGIVGMGWIGIKWGSYWLWTDYEKTSYC